MNRSTDNWFLFVVCSCTFLIGLVIGCIYISLTPNHYTIPKCPNNIKCWMRLESTNTIQTIDYNSGVTTISPAQTQIFFYHNVHGKHLSSQEYRNIYKGYINSQDFFTAYTQSNLHGVLIISSNRFCR